MPEAGLQRTSYFVKTWGPPFRSTAFEAEKRPPAWNVVRLPQPAIRRGTVVRWGLESGELYAAGEALRTDARARRSSIGRALLLRWRAPLTATTVPLDRAATVFGFVRGRTGTVPPRAWLARWGPHLAALVVAERLVPPRLFLVPPRLPVRQRHPVSRWGHLFGSHFDGFVISTQMRRVGETLLAQWQRRGWF